MTSNPHVKHTHTHKSVLHKEVILVNSSRVEAGDGDGGRPWPPVDPYLPCVRLHSRHCGPGAGKASCEIYLVVRVIWPAGQALTVTPTGRHPWGGTRESRSPIPVHDQMKASKGQWCLRIV